MSIQEFCSLTTGAAVGALESTHPSGFVVGGMMAGAAAPPAAGPAAVIGGALSVTATIVQSSPGAGELLGRGLDYTCNEVLDYLTREGPNGLDPSDQCTPGSTDFGTSDSPPLGLDNGCGLPGGSEPPGDYVSYPTSGGGALPGPCNGPPNYVERHQEPDPPNDGSRYDDPPI